MIIDTSVLIGILRREGKALSYYKQLLETDTVYLPAPAFLEATIVARHKNVSEELNELIGSIDPIILSFTQNMAEAARDAFAEYGKGQGHAAQLNFGDCMVYGAAKSEKLPLLYIGNDFEKTDLG